MTSQHSKTAVAMSDMNREEIDAKLTLVEARTETRFVELNAKLDHLLDAHTSFKQVVSSEFARMSKDFEESRREVMQGNSYTRWTIIVAVVPSMLAAVGALWVTQGNLLSAFQAVLAATAIPHH